MKFPSTVENYNVIEPFGWDYWEEVFAKLFSLKEFFKEKDLEYILEEVNVMCYAWKFEPSDLHTKG